MSQCTPRRLVFSLPIGYNCSGATDNATIYGQPRSISFLLGGSQYFDDSTIPQRSINSSLKRFVTLIFHFCILVIRYG